MFEKCKFKLLLQNRVSIAMLKKEMGKASLTSLDLQPPYSTEVAVKPDPTKYKVSRSKIQWQKRQYKRALVHFLDSMPMMLFYACGNSPSPLLTKCTPSLST